MRGDIYLTWGPMFTVQSYQLLQCFGAFDGVLADLYVQIDVEQPDREGTLRFVKQVQEPYENFSLFIPILLLLIKAADSLKT